MARLHCGMKSPLGSAQSRVTLFTSRLIGLLDEVTELVSAKENVPRPTRCLFALALNAVRPVPKRSQVKPSRRDVLPAQVRHSVAVRRATRLRGDRSRRRRCPRRRRDCGSARSRPDRLRRIAVGEVVEADAARSCSARSSTCPGRRCPDPRPRRFGRVRNRPLADLQRPAASEDVAGFSARRVLVMAPRVVEAHLHLMRAGDV